MSVACVPDLAAGVPEPLHEIRCIVAATDLSPHGNEAVRYALSLAPTGSRVVVVHVLEPGEIAEEERKKVLEGLSALTIGAEVIERGIDARVEMIESDGVAKAICAAAERENADLLCIGTRGRSRLPRMILGSVSQAILLLCRRPVVIIP